MPLRPTAYGLPLWLRAIGWLLLLPALVTAAEAINPNWRLRLNPHTDDLIIMLAIVTGHSAAHVWMAVALLLFALGLRRGTAPSVAASTEFLLLTALIVISDILVRVLTLGGWGTVWRSFV